jgi:cytochrome c biogenesis protein CcmG/thiol:disulfide interchange protein DsbE
VDYEGGTAIDFGIYGAPETFLVDADGIVRWKQVGAMTDAIVDDELLPLLDALEKRR